LLAKEILFLIDTSIKTTFKKQHQEIKSLMKGRPVKKLVLPKDHHEANNK
jgi:hypothetical protein